MAIPKPIPLFPTYDKLKAFDWRDYPQLNEFFEHNPQWFREHWQWARDYLIFLGRNKSEHTFIRFRSDIEKFLLWSFLIHLCNRYDDGIASHPFSCRSGVLFPH